MENLEEIKDQKAFDEKSLKIALSQFFQGCQGMYKYKASAKGILRAFDFAVNKGLTDRGQKIKLRNDVEKQLSMLFGIILDARLIMLSKAAKDEKLKEDENQEQGENDNV